MPKWADVHIVLQYGFLQYRIQHLASLAQARIAQDGVRPDGAVLTDLRLALQVSVRPNSTICPNAHARLDIGRSRIDQGHTCQHPALVDTLAQRSFRLGQMDACVDADGLIKVF